MFHSVVGEKKKLYVRLLSALLLCVTFLFLAGPAATAQAKSTAGNEATAKEVFDTLNAARAKQGLDALSWDDTLASCSAVRAQEIRTRFSHVRPDGRQWYTVNADVQYGENLLQTTNSSDAATVFATWTSSKAHRALFYDASYETAAIAKYESGGRDYWVIEFGY